MNGNVQNGWLDHVKKTFEELKKFNPEATLKEAMQEAKKTYKKGEKMFGLNGGKRKRSRNKKRNSKKRRSRSNKRSRNNKRSRSNKRSRNNKRSRK